MAYKIHIPNDSKFSYLQEYSDSLTLPHPCHSQDVLIFPNDESFKVITSVYEVGHDTYAVYCVKLDDLEYAGDVIAMPSDIFHNERLLVFSLEKLRDLYLRS